MRWYGSKESLKGDAKYKSLKPVEEGLRLDQPFHQRMPPRPPQICPIGSTKPLSNHRHKPGRNFPSFFSPFLVGHLRPQFIINRLSNICGVSKGMYLPYIVYSFHEHSPMLSSMDNLAFT